MELKHILSVNFETLTDEEREELYTAITWFDGDDIETKRCRNFIKISQEVLKYKGEQVETLLHELEEMAVKQGEDEARRQESEAETKSGRSRKSSSIEHENLEQKYLELKSKHKKLLRSNEKKDVEIEKFTKRVSNLEQENRKLQNELESTPRVLDSESDVSETIKDQQKELVQTIHSKNKQISDLLRDIEEVENENYVLRDKLSNVRDELSVATKEINNMTDLLKERDATIKESLDQISQLRNECVKFKAEKEQIERLKEDMEKELKDSLKTCKETVEELTKLCKEKDATINDLKGKLKEPSLNSSISSLPKDESEVSHVNAIQKLLMERDKQLMELKIQLQAAAREMEESAGLIKSLKKDKEKDHSKLAGLEGKVKELKKQLKGVHERCRSLQEEVEFAEKTSNDKNEELKQILNKMNENGQVELVVNLQEIQTLKAENRLKERQIAGLVKVSNKLQEDCDQLEMENVALREQVGLAEEEPISLTSYHKKEKKRQKELESLKTKLRKLEESNIQLKSDIHKSNQLNSSLTNQLLELGQKPNTHRYQISSNDGNLKNDNKALSEENEALRKGLHEILNSVNVKRSSTPNEIKSETLEKLLRALDVKHISGWYHPAMRLQAELHNIEGINAELRNQLKDARVQLQWYQSTDESLGEKRPESSMDQIECRTQIPQVGEFDDFEIDDVNTGLKRFFEIINIKTPKIEGLQDKLTVSLRKLTEDKRQVDDELSQAHHAVKEIKEKMNFLEEKLKILDCDDTDERLKNLDEILKTNVSLKRQTSYLENENKKLSTKLESAYKDISTAESVYLKNLGDLQRKITLLDNQLKVTKNLKELSIDYEVHKETERNLNEMTIKYRTLALDLKRQTEERSLEMKMLQESQEASETEKNDLKKKLMETSSKLTLQNVQKFDEKTERLAQKLSELEITELTERQRANHTNNLYELVKEQLKKSEERFQEYSKYNEELLKKNLVLQEQLGEAESKIVDFVDKKLFQQLKQENNNLLSENEKLTTNVSELEEALKLERTSYDNQKTWNDHKEQELLNLKHQIVDLVSITDEKVIISQLNNDILQCRQSQAYYRTKYKETIEELGSVREKLDKNQAKYEDERNALLEKETILNEKIINLQKLMQKQKLQYLGCIPLCSEESYLDLLKYITKERHESFLNLCKSKTIENEAALLKEQLEVEVTYVKRQKDALLNGGKEEMKNILNWLQEKKALQINELRYKRQAEFKEQHLKHFSERIQLQDEQILKLEEELLMWQKNLDVIQIPSQNPTKPKSPETNPINSQTVEVQTVEPVTKSEDFESSKLREELAQKTESINQLKNKLTELEMSVSMFKKQLGDKQSQITFYERHIMELQNKKEEIHPNGAGGDNLGVGVETNMNEELIALKASAKTLQDNLKAKEDEIMRYQTLLKVDRDKHSLAAATLQEELKGLQRQLSEERQKTQSLEETFAQSRPNKGALDEYMEQVSALEKHTSDLHTKVISLETQLQSSKDEASRWKNLANDRLFAMEDLGKNLDEQHKHELMAIKSDTEKFKELTKDEMNNLRQLLDKQRVMFSGKIDIDLMKLVAEKDERINELSTKLRMVKKNIPSDTSYVPNLDLEGSFDMLQKENEVLKKRCEQLLAKEKNAKEEIRELKAQLLKKPMSGRSDKSEKTIKEQLQKKVSSLENEVESLKRSLADQISINETHKVQASDDFDKWKKLKHWQQIAEKLKNKLKEREGEFEKMQQTSVGYRMLIERLEREKHNLENRIKSLKSNHPNLSCNREIEYLRLENLKLQSDLEALNSRLEMNQHHSGGLGAAMMQEKLESQERKIAVLELSSKGTVEIRAELERSQTVIANLQKSNLRLEAENLELKLDQEKCNKEVPHLLQQIQHLESYIEVLKNENTQFEAGASDEKQPQGSSENKRVSELERTVFVLKRVVEKLQAENKRLMNGKRPISDRAASADKAKRENVRLKEKLAESVEKIGKLEQELSHAKGKLKNVSILRRPDDGKVALCDELAKVKEQLEQKSSLLDKVKLLLTRAAAKEKLLLQEIAELKSQKEITVAPIPEESEDSSSDL